MSKELLVYLSKKVNEEMQVIEKDMAMGAAKDYPDYRYAAGIYRGLLVANNILIETSERMEKDDE